MKQGVLVVAGGTGEVQRDYWGLKQNWGYLRRKQSRGMAWGAVGTAGLGRGSGDGAAVDGVVGIGASSCRVLDLGRPGEGIGVSSQS